MSIDAVHIPGRTPSMPASAAATAETCDNCQRRDAVHAVSSELGRQNPAPLNRPETEGLRRNPVLRLAGQATDGVGARKKPPACEGGLKFWNGVVRQPGWLAPTAAGSLDYSPAAAPHISEPPGGALGVVASIRAPGCVLRPTFFVSCCPHDQQDDPKGRRHRAVWGAGCAEWRRSVDYLSDRGARQRQHPVLLLRAPIRSQVDVSSGR
jgi:hypothetical protein